jgi:hypothetical protein
LYSPMSVQAPRAVLMVRPLYFGFNTATAASNAFQSAGAPVPADEASVLAREEFDRLAQAISAAGVEVHLFDEPEGVPGRTPDAVFPNNWVSFHADGTVVLYPMMAENRRAERRQDILEALAGKFKIREIWDLSAYEQSGRYLEGTGSVVFDHLNRMAYANHSPRTDPELLALLCGKLDYEPFLFHARDSSGKEIYHTNVLLAVGEECALVCLESVQEDHRQKLLDRLQRGGRRVISLAYGQMLRFAGNAIQLQSRDGTRLMVMSRSAHASLTGDQLHAISLESRVLSSDLPTIETLGGGSARCMIAGIHLPAL